jgi:diguanylate cyclase (GGDEF)-like protein/PAS domain S-box-containing protein
MLSIFLLAVLEKYLSYEEVCALFFIQTSVFLYRVFYIYQFYKKKESITNEFYIRKWVQTFKNASLFSGIAWSCFFLFLNYTPVEYNLMLLATIIGLATMGISTLGSILSVYLSFVIPMLSLTFLWIILQSLRDEFYSNMIIPFMLFVAYLFVFARKFESTYIKSFTEEDRVKFLKKRMELALDGSSTAILDWNTKDNDFFISDSWKMLLDFDADELVNEISMWAKRIHIEDRKELFSSLKKHFKDKKEVFESVHRLEKKYGDYIWVFARVKILYDDKGKASRVIGTHTDITQRKLMEADIVEKKKLLEESQRLAHIGSWRYDFSSDKLSWSDEIYRIFEVQKDIKPSYELLLSKIHPDEKDEVDSTYKNSLTTKQAYELTHRLIFDDAKVKYIKGKCETNFSKDGTPLVSIGTVQDITKQKLLENMLHEQKEIMSHLAHHDILTALPNRTLFNDRLRQAIQKAKRDSLKFAVLFIDLDHFKEINDSFGHDIGDEVLKTVSHKINAVLRDGDTFARLGGDEFTIIMENLEQEPDASILAQKILNTMVEPVLIQDNYFYLSCSIGISLYPNDGTTEQDLLKYADSAMYKAKEEGRNNFVFYSSEMTALAFERVVMEVNLRKALQNNEFEVYYQPQVNAKTNTIIGMEALVRWNYPGMGLLIPSKFIPIAESTGLIVKLDRYVIKAAMYQLKEWHKKGYKVGVLSLNLSMQQLKQKDFVSFIKELLEETKCQANWLGFEVTESHIMTNTKEAIEILTELSELGATISVDDFGTGYSSLSYLKRLPIDKLKIDQSFIHSLPDDEEDVAIVCAVIALAKSLKLDLIAEGVENKRQKDFMLQSGCEDIQGYYYAKPLKKESFEKILKDGLRKEQ